MGVVTALKRSKRGRQNTSPYLSMQAVSEVPESLQPSVQPSLRALSQQQTNSSGARYTDTLPPNTGHTTTVTSDSDTHGPMPVGSLGTQPNSS